MWTTEAVCVLRGGGVLGDTQKNGHVFTVAETRTIIYIFFPPPRYSMKFAAFNVITQ